MEQQETRLTQLADCSEAAVATPMHPSLEVEKGEGETEGRRGETEGQRGVPAVHFSTQ
jgi:hypothetical protein